MVLYNPPAQVQPPVQLLDTQQLRLFAFLDDLSSEFARLQAECDCVRNEFGTVPRSDDAASESLVLEVVEDHVQKKRTTCTTCTSLGGILVPSTPISTRKSILFRKERKNIVPSTSITSSPTSSVQVFHRSRERKNIVPSASITSSVQFLNVDSPREQRTGIFSDMPTEKQRIRATQEETIRRRLEQAVFHPIRDAMKGKVEHHDSGFAAHVVASKWFDNTTMACILSSAIWLSIDADYNTTGILSEAPLIFQVVQNAYCVFFTGEVAIRFLSLKRKRDTFRDAWFCFDAILVGLMVFETWGVAFVDLLFPGFTSDERSFNPSLFRLLRLVRLTRLNRLLRAVPELLYMLKGIFEAARSVACTICMLFVILYVLGIMMRQLSLGTEFGKKHFRSVPMSVWTLFINVALLDGAAPLLSQVVEESVVCACILLCTIVLASMTLMNMLIGILCEVVTSVARAEKERMDFEFVKGVVRKCLSAVDVDNDDHISRNEFEMLIQSSDAVDALTTVGVDLSDLVEFADPIFQSDVNGLQFNKKLLLDEFMEILMMLRGINGATVKDIVNLRKFIHDDTKRKDIMLAAIIDNQKILYARLKPVARGSNLKESSIDAPEKARSSMCDSPRSSTSV